MKKCKYCHTEVNSNHFCDIKKDYVYYDDDSNFLLSAIVGAITDSAIIGTLVGGDPLGAVLGLELEGFGIDSDTSDGFSGGDGSFGGGGASEDY